MTAPVLELQNVSVQFRVSSGWVPAVKRADLVLRPAETLAIVGESGCGKSSLALAIMRLIPQAVGRVDGSILLDGRNLLELDEIEMADVRGRSISMIFQEPMTSLNPLIRVGDQVVEAILRHESIGRAHATERALRLFNRVGIPNAAERLAQYPHQLSGGLRQRVMIAMALACGPRVLIADEPTTALDVTIQAQVLALIRSLQQEFGMSVVLITHDLGVVAQVADRVMVMYAGRTVEEAPVATLFSEPRHPYTQGLLDCVPRVDNPAGNIARRMAEIPGSVTHDEGSGCCFRNRCAIKVQQCEARAPALEGYVGNRRVACFRAHS